MTNDPTGASGEAVSSRRPNADPAEERAATWFKMAQAYETALLDVERIAVLAIQQISRCAEPAPGGHVIPSANFDGALALLSAIRSLAKHTEVE